MKRARDRSPYRNEGGAPASATELGRMLRRVRTRQGLRLEEAAFRAGLPLEHLNALETATFDRSLDRVAILRSLRTYANFLGLPGERLVLTMIDLWPGTRAPTTVGSPRTSEVTRMAATAVPSSATATGVLPVVTPQDTATLRAERRGDRVGAPDATALLAVTRPPAAPTGGPTRAVEHTAQVPRVLADTGPVPAVAPPKPPRSPLLLRAAVTVVALAVLAGATGLVVDHYRPAWLRSLGITHAPGSAPGGVTTNSVGTGVHHDHPTTTTPAGAQFTVGPASATGVTLSVRAPTFTAQVVAVGGEAWTQVTDAAGGQPLYAGILPDGQSQTFTNQRDLVVNIGSKAAHVFVSVGGRTVGYYLPQIAPFTIRITGGA